MLVTTMMSPVRLTRVGSKGPAADCQADVPNGFRAKASSVPAVVLLPTPKLEVRPRKIVNFVRVGECIRCKGRP